MRRSKHRRRTYGEIGFAHKMSCQKLSRGKIETYHESVRECRKRVLHVFRKRRNLTLPTWPIVTDPIARRATREDCLSRKITFDSLPMEEMKVRKRCEEKAVDAAEKAHHRYLKRIIKKTRFIFIIEKRSYERYNVLSFNICQLYFYFSVELTRNRVQ